MLAVLLQLVGSVPTEDSRNIILWVVLAVIALVMVVLCGVMSAMSKKSGGKNSKKHDDKD